MPQKVSRLKIIRKHVKELKREFPDFCKRLANHTRGEEIEVPHEITQRIQANMAKKDWSETRIT
ncbi:MAG: hypothetical protein WC460_01265 [Patescibacteria group bacterium]